MGNMQSKVMRIVTCSLIITIAVVSLLSMVLIHENDHYRSDQLLLLLCETGERNLDYYFSNVQQSVEKVAHFAESDLNELSEEGLGAHIQRVRDYFESTASRTNGVLTFYYRVDPEVSDTEKGFWYTNLDGAGFAEHEVTDIRLYDMNDTSQLVWFTLPRQEGNAVWVHPYITENLDVRVISYNVPIYWKGRFFGVAGIEIDYSTMAEQVESIRFFHNGYAFLCAEDGTLFYHPRIDVTGETDKPLYEVPPKGVDSTSTFFQYSYGGIKKQAVWLPLVNGMRLTVSVPVSETKGDWRKLLTGIVTISVFTALASSCLTFLLIRRLMKKAADEGKWMESGAGI